MKWLDRTLDNTPMYRLVLNLLVLLLATAILLAAFGVLQYPTLGIIGSVLLACAVSFAISQFAGYALRVPINTESAAITGLIIACIMPPITSGYDALAIVTAAALAAASKFVLRWRGAHVFNPAAAGVLITALLDISEATWWIGSAVLLPIIVVSLLLLGRKLRRWGMMIACIVAALGLTLLLGTLNGAELSTTTWRAVASGPLLFLVAFMLTEPLTTPTGRVNRLLFGGAVGLVMSSQLGVGDLRATPELALIVGNIATLVLTPRQRTMARLTKRVKLTDSITELQFAPEKKLLFTPGQYAEWTLPLARTDSRGNRRSFSIASSPDEDELRIAYRSYPKSSRFKQALATMKEGEQIAVGPVSGEFTAQPYTQPVLFIAGGIGITPFRSMVLDAARSEADIALLYVTRTQEDAVYLEELQQALPKMNVVHLHGEGSASVTPEAIAQAIPDAHQRQWYISGPPAMARAYKHHAEALKAGRVHTDYFSGY